MVIGRDFVWAHMGKTGGNSCYKMFALVNDGSLVIDDIDDPAKHRAFEQESRAEGKARIMNFRRLGTWLISHNTHMAVWEGLPNPEYYIAEGLAWCRTGAITADELLSRYQFEDVKHWILTEYLGEDFISAIGMYLKIGRRQKSILRGTHENRGYAKILDKFDPNSCKKGYERNPVWATLEKKLYRDA